MNRKTFRIAALFAACMLLLLFPGGATSIDFTPSAVTVQKSANANVSLVLDEAPSGLAGYDLVIRFSRTGIVDIPEVSYPSWASLSNTTRNADGTIRIRGVDLNRQVEAGSTGITLATVTLRGLSGGTSSILVESVNMDADGGDLIVPNLTTGQVSVPGGGGMVTEEQGAVPWTLIILGIIILGVVLLVAFLAWQKERKE